MSIFKKVVGFFFDEEEEITEEGEMRRVEFREDPSKETISRDEVNTFIDENAQKKQSTSMPKVEPVTLPKQEEKHFVDIKIDDVPKRTTYQTPPTRKAQRSEPVKSEFEFTPVISPIFGADEKTVRKAKPVSVPKNRTAISASKKKNSYETVISPIYGSTNYDEPTKEPEVQAEPTLKRFVSMEHEDFDTLDYDEDVINEDIPVIDDDNEQDDLLNVPLEDLLSREEPNDNEEDLLQFSLFGDDEVVRNEKTDDSYTIKE